MGRTVDSGVDLHHALDGAAVDAAADLALHAGDDPGGQAVVQPEGVPDGVHLLPHHQVCRLPLGQRPQHLHPPAADNHSDTSQSLSHRHGVRQINFLLITLPPQTAGLSWTYNTSRGRRQSQCEPADGCEKASARMRIEGEEGEYDA